MRYYLQSAKKFLDLNWNKRIYHASISRHELPERIGLSYKPSLKMCKRNFGLTIKRFYIHCMVAEVKQFLTKPESREMKISEIALKFGHASRRNLHSQFKKVGDMTPGEFWYFHDHFSKTTGVPLVEYEQPELKRYLRKDGQPTFLSNFLNRQMKKVIYNEKHTA